MNKAFWSGRKVLLTGHTGFKGSWLGIWLVSLGADVRGVSLAANTKPSLYHELELQQDLDHVESDIRDQASLHKHVSEFRPEVVFHLAAQPLVRRSYLNPIETYSTNVMGTLNLLEAIRATPSVRAVVNVTTDKCYENREWVWGYRETDALGGHDIYSSSKACSEILTNSYRLSFLAESETLLATARAGNVVGGGDWAEDRLIPDILRAFEKSEPVVIRNPLSTRPWQHVLEPLSGYLVLAQELFLNGDEFAEGWNFGPKDEDCKPVSWILDEMVLRWGNNASWSLDKNNNPHEAGFLKLDCSKASNRLKWNPKWNLQLTLKSIVDWHQLYASGGDIKKQCLKEINTYCK